MKGPQVSGPWLGVCGGNANALPHPNSYSHDCHLFCPCGTMFLRIFFYFAGDMDTWEASDSVKMTEIAWTRVHTIINQARA